MAVEAFEAAGIVAQMLIGDGGAGAGAPLGGDGAVGPGAVGARGIEASLGRHGAPSGGGAGTGIYGVPEARVTQVWAQGGGLVFLRG